MGNRLTPADMAHGNATCQVGAQIHTSAGLYACRALEVNSAGIALLTRTTRLAQATPEMNLLYQLSVSALVLLLLAPLFGETIREPTALILGIFAFQVIVVVAIGFVVWFWILSIYPVSNMASFSLLTPVFGVLFGWLIFNDTLGAGFLVALALVGAGLILVNRP